MLETWEKVISRGGNFKMKETHTVCEQHFLPSCIVKPTPIVVDGIDVRPNGGKPYLLSSAIPTVLQGYPKYKIPTISKKRKSPQKRQEPVMKAKRLERAESSTSHDDEMICEDIPEEQEEILLMDQPFTLQDAVIQQPYMINRPSSSWHIHSMPTFTSFVHINSDGTEIDKFIKVVKEKREMDIALLGMKTDQETFPDTVEALEELLMKADDCLPCPGTEENNIRSTKCTIILEKPGSMQKPPPRCIHCHNKRKVILRAAQRQATSKVKKSSAVKKKYQKMKSLSKQLKVRNKKITSLQGKIEDLAAKCSALEKAKVDKYIENLAPSWRLAVLTMIQASKAKSSNGRRYTTNWVYECSLLRIKSQGLYKQMLRDNFLPIPSLSQLQRYMKKIKPAYGFNENIFSLIKEKAQHLPEAKRHGSLLIDEMKLMEGIHFDKHLLKVTGLVMYGRNSDGDSLTPDELKDIPADHALVFMFQGFQDQYIQSLSAHLSKGAVKGPDLAKLALEAISLLEMSGLHVDVVITDGATWNRNMWQQFGIRRKSFETEASTRKHDNTNYDSEDLNEDDNLQPAQLTKNKSTKPPTFQTKRRKNTLIEQNRPSRSECADGMSAEFFSCVQHPVDSNRKLWFGSDFPHLAKSMKQRILNAEELETPDGRVKLNHWIVVFKEDEKKGIKVAPKLSMNHFQSETYAAMSVKNSFQFFGEDCATAMEHYRNLGVPGLEDCDATVLFIRRINVLIDAMNSNTQRMGLKAPNANDSLEQQSSICKQCNKSHAENTPQNKKSPRRVLEDFLKYIEDWEMSVVPRDKRLTASTAFGLRITIQTALDLSKYLIEKVGYDYFMTRRMNQDALEHFFGKIRQGCGAHGHPDPIQFIQVFRMLSFKSLVKPPRGSNVEGGDMLQSLLSSPDAFATEQINRRLLLEKKFDEALDTGEIIKCAFSDHTYYQNLTVDSSALRNFGGYVARRTRKFSCARTCQECFLALRAPEDQSLREDDDIIHSRSAGYLITPSDALMDILEKVEMVVLEVFQISHLHEDLIFEVANQLKEKQISEVGCELHRRELTKNVISFYMSTRMIFACEEYNRRLSEKAHKKLKARQQQKMFRLTC